MRRIRSRKQDREDRLSKRKKATLLFSVGAMAMSTAATSNSSSPAPAAAVEKQLPDRRKPAAMLKASDVFKEALMHEEGVRQTVYRDVAGYPTVGVGHLVRPEDGLRVGDTIEEERVLDLLEEDLAHAERGVARLVGDLPLHQHEFDALVDLVFNVGEGNVSPVKSPTLNAAIAAGDYAAISKELATYTMAKGKVAKGLIWRGKRREAMFALNDYSDPRAAA